MEERLNDVEEVQNEIAYRDSLSSGARALFERATSYVATGLLGVLLGMTVFDPEPFIRGKSIEVKKNLYALVVVEGERNIFTDIANAITSPLPKSGASLDQVESSMNAMAAAQAFLGVDRADYLLVKDGGVTPLKQGDVIKDIALQAETGICSARGEITALYEISRFCGGNYSVEDSSGERVLKISPESAVTLNVSSVSFDRAGSIPRDLAHSKGSSAGLPLALSYLDSLTEGSLFSDTKVAATGTLNSRNGLVAQVGGLEYKLLAAAQSGVEIAIVPMGQEVKVKGYSMEVFGVYTVLDAVYILCKRGSSDEICDIFKE
ncbi:MAG: S16 family serine protease [Candidatus Paceibacterota bacterium]